MPEEVNLPEESLVRFMTFEKKRKLSIEYDELYPKWIKENSLELIESYSGDEEKPSFKPKERRDDELEDENIDGVEGDLAESSIDLDIDIDDLDEDWLEEQFEEKYGTKDKYIDGNLSFEDSGISYEEYEDMITGLIKLIRLGRIVPRYKDYLFSEDWEIRKNKLMEELGSKCSKCSVDRKLNLHHKHYKNLGFETKNDVVLLCKDCHSEVHNKKTPTWTIKKEDTLIEMYDEGKSVEDISEKVNLTPEQVKSKIYPLIKDGKIEKR